MLLALNEFPNITLIVYIKVRRREHAYCAIHAVMLLGETDPHFVEPFSKRQICFVLTRHTKIVIFYFFIMHLITLYIVNACIKICFRICDSPNAVTFLP